MNKVIKFICNCVKQIRRCDDNVNQTPKYEVMEELYKNHKLELTKQGFVKSEVMNNLDYAIMKGQTISGTYYTGYQILKTPFLEYELWIKE